MFPCFETGMGRRHILLNTMTTLRFNRFTLFAEIVWRRATEKHRVSFADAWQIACIVYGNKSLPLERDA
jgi:hypothetical protein